MCLLSVGRAGRHSSRHGGDFSGRFHSRDHIIQPHKWYIEVHLDPAGSAGHILATVLRPPAFHETYTNGAHLSELIDSLKALIHALS